MEDDYSEYFGFTREEVLEMLEYYDCADKINSNRESGLGRYDIQLRPLKDRKAPGILIELKVLREQISDDQIESELEKAATEALAQIDKKQYLDNMKQDGITQFLKIGVSFHKKQVRLKSVVEKF